MKRNFTETFVTMLMLFAALTPLFIGMSQFKSSAEFPMWFEMYLGFMSVALFMGLIELIKRAVKWLLDFEK